jgi:hypothetical protein
MGAAWVTHLIYLRGTGVCVFGLAFAARFISGSLPETRTCCFRGGSTRQHEWMRFKWTFGSVAGEAVWTRFEWHLRRLRTTLMQEIGKAKSRQRSGSTPPNHHMSSGC